MCARAPFPRVIALVAVVAGTLWVSLLATAGHMPPSDVALGAGSSGGTLPAPGTLHVAGLDGPATVTFEANGTPHIQAVSDHDFFLTVGYLHATFRLFQMDVMRRLGEGLLSEVIGDQTLPSDKFEDMLGLQRTAQAEWDMLPQDSPARQALIAYAQGVNDRIQEDLQGGQLPILFAFLGNYQPKPWTPVDSLVVGKDLTQALDLSDNPLTYAVLVKTLGYRRTMQWFPVLPPNAQHPYDLGPYARPGHGGPGYTAPPRSPRPRHGGTGLRPAQTTVSPSEYRAALSLLQRLVALPATAMRRDHNSNNWAVTGAKTASGKSLMAGDPHLSLMLPSVWYQYAADSPGYHVAGVSLPGIPFVIIGHNQHISWSETNGSHQETLFYLEKTGASHPGQYYWKGAWRQMRRVLYDIPVKGADPVHYEVDITVHGPLWSRSGVPDERPAKPVSGFAGGQTITVDWMGAHPGTNLSAISGVDRASNYQQFRQALRAWGAPSQNFVYADDRGNIGMISAGWYPIVKHGAPWLPLPGTGASDVAGMIPFRDIPQSYDPPDHIVFSANQRQVGKSYPYYLGTTLDFDPGYRANRIYQVLHAGQHLTMRDMEKLQLDQHDYLASRIVPKLLAALQGASLTSRQRRAAALLRSWDGAMTVDSPAASLWWFFLRRYVGDTFEPWWKARGLPATVVGTLRNTGALSQDVEAWTLHDPGNPAFWLPHGAKRTAPQVMRAAFKEAVAALAAKLGPDPTQWRWGKLHELEIDSLLGGSALGVGPRPRGGDRLTVNVAGGDDFDATAGPSWRMIVDWGHRRTEGVYPGGEAEDFRSPWYKNQVDTWWKGHYYTMLDYPLAQSQPGSITWTLQP